MSEEPEELLRDRPWSKVVRRGDIYVKTVAPALRHKVGLHVRLAARRPELVPAPLSADPERGEFTLDYAGPMLREAAPTLEHWERLLPLYARLQKAECAFASEHLARGVPDRRPDALVKLFPEIEGLSILAERVSAGPVPDSLNHGDLHDGNVFVGGPLGFWILDWGDASVAHPFGSLRTAMVSVENRFGLDEDDPALDGLREIYLAEWTDFAPLEELVALERLVRPLASLTSALAWRAALSSATDEEAAPFARAVPALIEECRELLPPGPR